MKIFNRRFLFWFIVALALFTAYVDVPNIPLKLNWGPVNLDTNLKHPELDFSLGSLRIKRDLEPKLGLDLQGGTHLVLSADMKDIPSDSRENALESAKTVIERRGNFFGG